MFDGERLRYWREARTLTLRELAERAGTDHTALSFIERGKRMPRPSMVRKLAAALDIEPRDLLKDERDG